MASATRTPPSPYWGRRGKMPFGQQRPVALNCADQLADCLSFAGRTRKRQRSSGKPTIPNLRKFSTSRYVWVNSVLLCDRKGVFYIFVSFVLLFIRVGRIEGKGGWGGGGGRVFWWIPQKVRQWLKFDLIKLIKIRDDTSEALFAFPWVFWTNCTSGKQFRYAAIFFFQNDPVCIQLHP